MKNVPNLDESEVHKFHPHCDEMGGVDETKKIIKYVSNGSMKNVKCWSDGIRKLMAFSFLKKYIIIIWGNGNPTMFPASSEERIRTLSGGMNSVTSEPVVKNMREQVGRLGEKL